jgi:hypothetical protein
MLEFFGEDGARWLQGGYQDYQGRRCLIGALDHARHRLGIRSYAARDFLIAALPAGGRGSGANLGAGCVTSPRETV